MVCRLDDFSSLIDLITFYFFDMKRCAQFGMGLGGMEGYGCRVSANGWNLSATSDQNCASSGLLSSWGLIHLACWWQW